MTRRLLPCALGALLAACGAGPVALDGWGGALELPIGTPTGFFTVGEAKGRSFLVTPDGHAFLSMGVNNINPDGDVDRATSQPIYRPAVDARYGTTAAWGDATRARLARWGFNTAGAWSTDGALAELPTTPILDLAGHEIAGSQPVDYFDPAWEAAARARALKLARPRADEARVVGWFSDNELRWGADWNGPQDLLDLYRSFDAAAPGRQAAEAFLAARGGDDGPDARRAFASLVAERYFAVAEAAIRAAAPHHLYLGCRFVSYVTPREVAVAAGPHVDVISANHYEVTDDARTLIPALGTYLPTDGWLAELAVATGKPVLISEFASRADDAGLPNSKPFQIVTPVYATQAARADALERYGRALAEAPHLVGLHWFQWVDEPASGRFDGEDSNWGLVAKTDEPYAELTERAAAVGPIYAYGAALGR